MNSNIKHLFCPVDEADVAALVEHYAFKVQCWSYGGENETERVAAQRSLEYWQEQKERLA